MKLDAPNIPDNFVDDGCSNSPDAICGVSIRDACRIHDWRYCSRAHAEDTMSKRHRKAADKELRANIAADLPWYTEWIKWIYYRAVRRFGTIHSYNTCGPEAGRYCRHNLTIPAWMPWRKVLEDT